MTHQIWMMNKMNILKKGKKQEKWKSHDCKQFLYKFDKRISLIVE